MAPQRSHMIVLHMHFKGNYSKIFLPETTKPRAHIFCMKQHPVDVNQVCSNYVHGAKMAPSRGSHVLHRLLFGKTRKKLLA